MFWFTVLEGTFPHGREGVAAGESGCWTHCICDREVETVKPGVQIISYSASYPRQGDGATHIEDESSHLS